MLLADAGSSLPLRPATPPPPPPPPKTDTVQHGDTLESVAARNGVTAPELAQANGLDELKPIDVGQVLTVPPQTAQESKDEPVPQTPAARTDQAIKRYDDAVKAKTEGMKTAPPNMGMRSDLEQAYDADIATAQQNVDVAVKQEIGSQVAMVPRDIGLSTDSMINGYGKSIIGRHPGDATGTSAINSAIADYRVQSQANAIAQTDVYGANVTPLDRVNALKGALQGQPQAVSDRVLEEPRVQQMLKQAADWVGEPYKGVNTSDLTISHPQAVESSQRLADLTSGMPPAMAAQLVQQTMPTIDKIATEYSPDPSATSSFNNLSKVAGSLGNSPDGQTLTAQIAQSYSKNNYEVRQFGALGDSIVGTISQGTDPSLSLALAQQMQSSGNTDAAKAMLGNIGQGLDEVQGKIGDDLKNYGDVTQELSQAIDDTNGLLSPADQQKAINAYLAKMSPDDKKKLGDAESAIINDVAALNHTATVIKYDMPAGLQGSDSDLQGKVSSILGDDKIQSAESFALSQRPELLAGDDGNETAELLTEVGHKSKDLTESLAKAYITGHVLPAVGNLNPNDPASVARAESALSDLRGKAALMGIPQEELDTGVNKLENIVQTLQTTKSTDAAVKGIYDLDKVKSELSDLKDTPFSSGPASLAFRTLAFGLSGGVFLNQVQKTADDPSVQNTLGSLAYSVGLAKDATSYAASFKLLDENGALSKWAEGTSLAGAFTEKFIGALNIGYYAAGAFTDASNGNVAGVAFDTTGAVGSALAAFGEGAWAGPVGVGLTLIAAVGMAAVDYRESQDSKSEGAEKLLEDAGLDENVAKTLSEDGVDSSHVLRDNLGMTPAQLQTLAQTHPELFGASGYAQSLVDAAKACGIQGQDVPGFVDAMAKDNPDYLSTLFNERVAYDGEHPMSHSNLLFQVLSDRPNVRAFIQQHAPEELTQAADDRRSADSAYEMLNTTDTPSVTNLLYGKSAAYQAEVVKILKDQGLLDGWVKSLSTNYDYNNWPQAARSAILAAEGQGVLSQEEGQAYVNQLP